MYKVTLSKIENTFLIKTNLTSKDKLSYICSYVIRAEQQNGYHSFFC